MYYGRVDLALGTVSFHHANQAQDVTFITCGLRLTASDGELFFILQLASINLAV